MKKFISLLVCLCMVLTLIPAFSAAATTANVPTYCRVLFEEDFEDENNLITFTHSSTHGRAAVAATDDYGLGSYNYEFQSLTTTAAVGTQFNLLEKVNLRADRHTSTKGYLGYTTEVSFDWNPIDNTGNKQYVYLKAANTDGTSDGNFATITYENGDIDTITVASTVGSSSVAFSSIPAANNADHSYRIRILLKPYTEVIDSNAGEMKVYVDNVLVYDGAYLDRGKETYLYSLNLTSRNARVTLDNIQVIDYWDAISADTANAVTYCNKDALVSGIRTVLLSDSYTAAEAEYITGTAKAVYENASATQSEIDSAVSTLNARKTEIDGAVYSLLSSDDFETNSFNSFSNNTGSRTSIPVTAGYYGFGNYYYQLSESADGTALSRQYLFDAKSSNVRTDGNKAQVSFDFVPSTNDSSISISCTGASNEKISNSLASIAFADGVMTVKNRNGAITTSETLTYTAGKPMRVRFVFEAASTGDTMQLYVDGVGVLPAGTTYADNSKEALIAGVSVYSGSGEGAAGSIDNIVLLNITSGSPVNKDALVAAIRDAEMVEAEATEIGLDLDSSFDTILNNAKVADANTSIAQDTVNSAATALSASLEGYLSYIAQYNRVKDFGWSNVNTSNIASKAQDTVYEDLALPTTYYNGTETLDVVWESSNPSVISATGKVTRPMLNEYVTLTAKFSEGGGEVLDVTKSFKVRVLAGGKVYVGTPDEEHKTFFYPNVGLTKSKFLVSITGAKGEYKLGFVKDSKTYSVTFTEDGDFDFVFEKGVEYFNCTTYQNGVQVETVTTEIPSTDSTATLRITKAVDMARVVAIDLDEDKAYVENLVYNDGEYEYNVPTPGASITKAVVRFRDDVSNATLYTAVYKDDALYDIALTPVSASLGEIKTFTLSDISLPSDITNTTIKVFLLENGTIMPLMVPASYDAGTLYEERISVFMIGDSTMETQDRDDYPRMGWGQVFGNYFDEENVVVKNYAKSGRTTRWFKESGAFDGVMQQIRPGDYLIMQFAHNDQKKTNNISIDDYKTLLGEFVDAAEEKGAIPVIASSIARRTYDENDTFVDKRSGWTDTLGNYVLAAKSVADTKNVNYIDLYEYTSSILSKITKEKASSFYCIIPNYIVLDAEKMKSSKYYNGGNYTAVTDDTHPSEYGANTWAKYAAWNLSTKNLSISSFVTVDAEPTADGVIADIEAKKA